MPARLDKTIGMNTSHQYCAQLSREGDQQDRHWPGDARRNRQSGARRLRAGATVRGLGTDGATGALWRCHGGAWKVTGSTAVEGRGSGRSANSGVISEEVFACNARLIRSSNSTASSRPWARCSRRNSTARSRSASPIRGSTRRLAGRRNGRRGGRRVDGFRIGGRGFAHTSQYPPAAVRAPARTLQCFADGRRRRGPRSAEVWRLISRRR